MTGIRLDYVALLVLFLVNVGLPFVVDLVVKRFAATPAKAFVLLVLQLFAGVVVGFGATHNQGGVFDWSAAVQGFIVSVIFGAATTFKLHNLNLIGAQGPVAKTLPGGLGQVDRAKTVDPGLVDGLPGRHEAP